MPHAENQVNGDKPTSKTISHLTSYPVVSDSISTVKSNPYGAKSINLAHNTASSILGTLLPYARGPYSYISPYVSRADQLADNTLTNVDDKFPIIKQDTEKIKSSVLDLAFMPLRMAGEGKDYVFKTYGSEYKKCGGDGYVASGKAMVTTGLVVTSDGLAWLSEFLGRKKEEGKGMAKEGKEYTKEKTGNK